MTRFSLLKRLMANLDVADRVPTILDIGGYESFWEPSGLLGTANFTILNLERSDPKQPMVGSVVGDARDLAQFETGSFDLVFSNSVIEHVGTWDDQSRMAAEIRRVGRSYFVQTPNYWFPLEPHFLVPGFQWLPLAVRARLLENFDLGHIARQRDARLAFETVQSIRLLREHEVSTLFPEAVIWRERFLGVTKSLVAYRILGPSALRST